MTISAIEKRTTNIPVIKCVILFKILLFTVSWIIANHQARVAGKCDSGRIRTCDPQLRRLLLYPAELRNLDEF